MTSEPRAIQWLRDHVRDDQDYLTHVLAAYDAVVAERDAAVRELRIAAVCNESQSVQIEKQWKEADTLRARLAACERVVEEASVMEALMTREFNERVEQLDEAIADQTEEVCRAVRDYRTAVATAQGEQ